MKSYLSIIIVGSFAILAFLFFIMMISNSSTLIKKLKKSKANILVDISILLIGIVNVGFIVYLLQDIREQISRFGGL